jgi:hypothetical protein
MQSQCDSFDFVIRVKQHELFVLPIALEHGDVFHLSADLDVSLIKFEARIEVASFSQRIDLFDLIIGLVAAACLFYPSEEHGMMEVPNRGRHELSQAGVDDFLRLIV